MRPPHPAREQPLHPLTQPRRWLLNYAFNNAEAAIKALPETAALEDDAPEAASAPADTQNPVRRLDELSALGDPCLRW